MPATSATIVKSTLVFLGAGIGGLLRYWIGSAVQTWWGPAFPLGTLVVNISGCLAMGFLGGLWVESAAGREEYRLVVLVGVLGGYTTFSSFARETMALANAGEWLRVGAYVVGSVVLSLIGVYVGAWIANRFFGVTHT